MYTYIVSVPISCPRDALRWVKGYFKRWGIEDTIRFWKQRFGLEDIRTTDIGNFKKLLWMTDLKLRRGLIALTHRPRLPEQVAFLYYRLQDGVGKLFHQYATVP